MKPVSECTRDELRAEAKERAIVGRGKMSKDELVEAITWARAGDSYVGLEMVGPGERKDAPAQPVDAVQHLAADEPARLATSKLSNARRRSNYMKQNGSTKLTIRQERQLRRMARRGALDV